MAAFLFIDLLMMPLALIVIVTLIRAPALLSQLIGVRHELRVKKSLKLSELGIL
jgi:uncharacterized membrane protein